MRPFICVQGGGSNAPTQPIGSDDLDGGWMKGVH
jgi:hypothetical protein